MEGLALLAGIVAVVFVYQAWLFKAVKPRKVVTAASPEQLQDLFRQKVATLGWSIVSDDDSLVSQSPLITGIRQQIALEIIETNDGQTLAVVTVPRYVERVFGAPTKAHTIRTRISSIDKAQRSIDSSAVIEYA